MGYIYLITNTITKKQYIGQTLCKDIERRWKQHKSCDHNSIGRYLLAAYKKYGIESFKFQIICICFDEDCNSYEEEYIKKFNTLAPNGYNLRDGGKNSKQHPDSIKLRVESRKKTINERRLKGLPVLPPQSEEQKSNSSKRMKGENNPNYGKKITNNRKEKLSESMNKIWEERRKNGTFKSFINNGNFAVGHISPNRRRVGKYNDNEDLLEEYESTVEASEKNNINRQTISKVCNGNPKYKRAGGFLWKFISDQTLTS